MENIQKNNGNGKNMRIKYHKEQEQKQKVFTPERKEIIIDKTNSWKKYIRTKRDKYKEEYHKKNRVKKEIRAITDY